MLGIDDSPILDGMTSRTRKRERGQKTDEKDMWSKPGGMVSGFDYKTKRYTPFRVDTRAVWISVFSGF